MPFQWRDSVKNFKWQLDPATALPVATVETIGNGRWIMCCPCCGAGHCLLSNQPTIGLYEPLCTNGDHQPLWAFHRRQWVSKYPDAASHKRIQLVSAEAIATIPETKQTAPPPLEIVKPKRPRQSRKQAA